MESKVESSTGSEHMSEEMQNIHESFGQLRKDVMDLISHAFGLGRGGAEVAKDGAAHAVETLKERLAEMKDQGAESFSSLEHRIEEKPLQAALLAFGVGFILAKIFSRK